MIPLLQKHINDFDIIHIHDCRSFQGIIAYLFAKRKKIPYVFQPHGSFLYSLPQSFSIKIAKLALDKLISEKIVKNASKVIASSQTEAQQYRDIGVPEEKIGIMSNGIDLSKYAELPPKGSFKKKYGIDEYEKIILYLGRIHRIKGIDFLVKAFAIVIKKLDDVKLVIVGPDDGYLKEIKALIKNLSMEKNILITGLLPDKDKLEAYVDADVYVLPSRFEAFPMSVLEAYSCGKPVIASKVGGLKDLVINGETGLLVEPGNTEQLAKNILYLLNDKGKAEEMGLKGRQLVEEKYAIDKVVAKLEKVYIEVAKSKMSEKF
jgi:glycosyltransferase involved in cell wall biosynthesis